MFYTDYKIQICPRNKLGNFLDIKFASGNFLILSSKKSEIFYKEAVWPLNLALLSAERKRSDLSHL